MPMRISSLDRPVSPADGLRYGIWGPFWQPAPDAHPEHVPNARRFRWHVVATCGKSSRSRGSTARRGLFSVACAVGVWHFRHERALCPARPLALQDRPPGGASCCGSTWGEATVSRHGLDLRRGRPPCRALGVRQANVGSGPPGLAGDSSHGQAKLASTSRRLLPSRGGERVNGEPSLATASPAACASSSGRDASSSARASGWLGLTACSPAAFMRMQASAPGARGTNLRSNPRAGFQVLLVSGDWCLGLGGRGALPSLCVRIAFADAFALRSDCGRCALQRASALRRALSCLLSLNRSISRFASGLHPAVRSAWKNSFSTACRASHRPDPRRSAAAWSSRDGALACKYTSSSRCKSTPQDKVGRVAR